MKNTIKFAALGACALAATSTAALAESTLPQGLTTGLTIGMPLPEGVYDISIANYGSQAPNSVYTTGNNEAYSLPVWVVWWTPWQIAGGRVVLDTVTGIGDLWQPGGTGKDSFGNTLVDSGIGWNLGNGLGVSLHAGAWLPSEQTLPVLLGRDYTSFQGTAAVSYVAAGWALSATGIYGSGGNKETINTGTFNGVNQFGLQTAQQADWFNLDLTAVKHFGKFETGVIAYGSWDLSNSGGATCFGYTGSYTPTSPTSISFNACKQSQFAVGGLVGYDFGTFRAQAKLSTDVVETNYTGKETRASMTLITRLWAPDAPLK